VWVFLFLVAEFREGLLCTSTQALCFRGENMSEKNQTDTLAPELVELRDEFKEVARKLNAVKPDGEKEDPEKIDVTPYLEHMPRLFGPTSSAALAHKIGLKSPLLYSTLRIVWKSEKFKPFLKSK
jgi:hypothetical protein